MGSVRGSGEGGSRRDNLSTGRVSTEKLRENVLRMAGITTVETYTYIFAHFFTSF